MDEAQKREAARDFIRSAVLPLIEEVLVKKFCQTMDVVIDEHAQQLNKELTLQLAAKDEVIKMLNNNIKYHRKEWKDQMKQDQGLPAKGE